MKSSNKGRLKPRFSWIGMGVALVIAAVMWYTVSVRDRIEGQIEVNINYYGIPSNLVVTSGLLNKITVRLKGPEALLRSLPRERLTDAISLASIKRGVTVVPIPTQHLSPAFRAFEIIDVQPPKLVVTADTIMERSVPVRAIADSPLKGGALTVENITVYPATVVLRGPESVVSGISNIPLSIPVDPKAAGTTVQVNMTLDTPSFVTSQPASVRVDYTITSGRTVISRRCPVHVTQDSGHRYSVEPKEVELLVEVPEALAKSSSYLGKIDVSALPPLLDAGESRRVKLRTRLPEGMALLNSSPEEVKITRLKK